MQKQSEIILNAVDVANISENPSIKTRPYSKVAEKTLFFDSLRYIFQGALDAEIFTVILLMAGQIWHTGINWKLTLTAVAFLGMIFTPITQQLANRSRWNNMQVSALYFTLISVAFLCAAFASSWTMFFLCMAIARICDKQQIPLMLNVYCDNYPKEYRGFRLGMALMCMPIGGIIFSQLIANSLGKNPAHLCHALLLASLLALLCAACFLKIPAKKIAVDCHPPLWDNFKLLAKDRLFTTILCLYSPIAIANQMTLPLRVEYLAGHKHGLDLSYEMILAILIVIQPLAYAISGPLWGKMYDRVNLITMRQCVTACFLVGIPLFFATDNIHMIYLASILLGIGRGGGVIFWSLWVSNIAPKEKVSEYMSANTAIIGLRDALAPIIGYYLLQYTSPLTVGVVAFLLLLISLLGFEYIGRLPSYGQRIAEMKNN
ncbi:MAG: MFS transporter [Puniceicoccales bacterium]|jgi:MFS family permease|nr:MFS transporter [Puniceicoccales bacterium]